MTSLALNNWVLIFYYLSEKLRSEVSSLSVSEKNKKIGLRMSPAQFWMVLKI